MGKKLELREQRDLLTVIRCMLCIIPKYEIEFRESLEGMLLKLSYPGQYDLASLYKELSLVMFDYYEKNKRRMWMQYVLSIFLDLQVSEIHKSNLSEEYIIMNKIKNLCDKGRLKAFLEIHEDEEYAHIRLKDTKTDDTVIIRTLSN